MRKLIVLILLLSSISATAQIVDPMEADESKFYVQTKQVNQFFRRFNGEESEKGDRYYPNDRDYRSEKLRRNYLKILFDDSNRGIPADLKRDFIKEVTGDSPDFINFHEDGWFAEVTAKFSYKGKEEYFTLYMVLEKAGLGYKWVIDRVHFEPFLTSFETDTAQKFLHPMSHELYFLNLNRVFQDPDQAVKYTAKDWQPDQLTLFLQEIREGKLKFISVSNLKFHFFQVPGWYFELSEFKRPGFNTGWLVSNLMRLSSQEERDIMERYIYNEKNQ